MLLSVFEYINKSGLLKKQLKLKTFTTHKNLVNVLENENPKEFRNGMRNCLENHFVGIFK